MSGFGMPFRTPTPIALEMIGPVRPRRKASGRRLGRSKAWGRDHLRRVGRCLETSTRDKSVGSIFALDEPSTRERQMSGNKPPFVDSEPVKEAQTGRYSAVGLMVDWDLPRRVLE